MSVKTPAYWTAHTLRRKFLIWDLNCFARHNVYALPDETRYGIQGNLDDAIGGRPKHFPLHVIKTVL